MKISFLGAAKTVTGSLFLLEIQNFKIIVDCGMFQGGKTMEEVNAADFAFDPSSIQAVILTHAHIDHTGRLPKLVKDGFNGKIFATHATKDLCDIMLRDSAHIQQMEAEWATRKNARRGEASEEPIYTEVDVEETMQKFKIIDYNKKIKLSEDIEINFINSGHMLGSAFVELYIHEDGKEAKYIFTGDVGNYNQYILKDPAILKNCDYLIIESTYGNRYHEQIDTYRNKLLEIIKETLKRNGNIVIPSFAVGRTQEILYELNYYKENNLLDEFAYVPVYVDSPLASQATEVFKRHYNISDKNTKELLKSGDDPLVFDGLKYSITTQESIAINNDSTPKIIISASGMCDAGRIRHHLKYNLWQEKNSIVFVGYQAPGSLGRLLVEGESMIKLFGEQVIVKAQIHTIDVYSGHADLNGLLNVISTMQTKPKKVVLVHGEEDAIVNFSNEIKERLNIPTVIPSYGDIADLALEKEIIDRWNVEPLPVKTKLSDSELPKPVGRNRKIISGIQQIANLTLQLKKEISASASDRITDYVNIISNILKDEIKNDKK
jgi:metallo-beta-lactamase family protein